MLQKEISLAEEDFRTFLLWLPRIAPFSEKSQKPPMTAQQFHLMYKISYYCALRVEETLSLKKSDFDLDEKILQIKKTRKSNYDKTTIPPILIGELKTYLKTLNDNEPIFNCHRATTWKYAKNAGKLAGLKLFKSSKKRPIEGLSGSLFRNSYKTKMFQEGADKNLVELKLRAKTNTNYGNYTIQDLKDWEKRHFKEFLSEDDIKENVTWYKENRILYEKLANKVKTIIQEILDSKKILYHDISDRTKTMLSFENKIRGGIHFEPKKMQDLAGIRIICYVKSDVGKVCEVIENNFDIDKNRSKDKSKILGEDKMGYSSIHYVAKLPKSRTDLEENKLYNDIYFEIQVRTILQHAWAEIEHDELYKMAEGLPNDIKRRFYLVSSVLESTDNEFENLHYEAQKHAR